MTPERKIELNKMASDMVHNNIRKIFNERLVYQLLDLGAEDYAYVQEVADAILATAPLPPEYLEK